MLVLRLALPQPLGTELLLFVCVDDFVLRLQPSVDCIRRDLVHVGNSLLGLSTFLYLVDGIALRLNVDGSTTTTTHFLKAGCADCHQNQ